MSASRRDAGSGWAALATAPSQSTLCSVLHPPTHNLLNISCSPYSSVTSSPLPHISFLLLFFCICIFIFLISCLFPSPASSTFFLRIRPYFLSPNFPFFFVTLSSPLLFFPPFSSHFCLIFPFSLLSFLNLLFSHFLYFNIFSSSLLMSPCFSVLSSPLSFFLLFVLFPFFSAVFLCYLTFLPFLLLLSFVFSTFPFSNLISCPSSFSLLHIFLFFYLPFLPCILLHLLCPVSVISFNRVFFLFP